MAVAVGIASSFTASSASFLAFTFSLLEGETRCRRLDERRIFRVLGSWSRKEDLV